jgi:hypothetical protein
MGLHVERGRAASWLAPLSDLALLGWRGIVRSRSMSRRSIRLAIAAFVESIRRTDAFSPGFADAARSARLLEAAVRSMELGQAVELGTGERVAHG